MKKLLALLLVLVMVFSCVACGAKTEEPKDEGKKTYKFAFIYTALNFFWDEVTVGAEAMAKELEEKYGVEIEIYATAATDGTTAGQVQVLENCVNQGYDGICIAPVDPEACTPVIDRAIEQGIYVITIDTDAPNSKRLAFVGTDNVEFGRKLAEKAVELTGGEGKVVILNGMPTQLGMVQRLQGIREVLAENPGMVELDCQSHNGDFAAGMSIVENMVAANSEFTVLLYLDAGGENAVNVWASKGWTCNDKHAVLSDNMENVLNAVRDGTADATVVQRQYNWGYYGTEVLYNAINGTKPESDFVNTGCFILTKENIDEFYPAA